MGLALQWLNRDIANICSINFSNILKKIQVMGLRSLTNQVPADLVKQN